MDDNSFKLMQGILAHRTRPGQTVLDVGSYDVNGTHKPILDELKLEYLGGIDVREGPNVDWVVGDQDTGWPVPSADIVISSNCLEHVRYPWLWMEAVYNATKITGLVVVVAPWQWPIHEHPIDCWRILPDGMESLFGYVGLSNIEVGTREDHTYGIGWKL